MSIPHNRAHNVQSYGVGNIIKISNRDAQKRVSSHKGGFYEKL